MNHPHFDPGEVAYFVGFPARADYEAVPPCDVTIDSALVHALGIFPGHWVIAPDGRHFAAIGMLRKKPKPPAPREQVGDWDECVWRPEREVETT